MEIFNFESETLTMSEVLLFEKEIFVTFNMLLAFATGAMAAQKMGKTNNIANLLEKHTSRLLQNY
jgi:hypothetical protein